MAYTKEEIKVFEDKELRIVRQAILKKLIEKCKLEDVYGVDKVTKLAEKYVDYVYKERKETTKRGQVTSVGDDTGQSSWEVLAQGLNLAIPNSQNVKILNQIFDEYKTASKASANPTDILTCCIDKFGTYPTKSSSAEKVVEQLLKG